MGTSSSTRTRHNRTITVDFHDEATYLQLLGDGKAFLECVIAFVLVSWFSAQRNKATCSGGGRLTRHSHYVRVRLGGTSPSGGSSAPRVARCSRSSPTSS